MCQAAQFAIVTWQLWLCRLQVGEHEAPVQVMGRHRRRSYDEKLVGASLQLKPTVKHKEEKMAVGVAVAVRVKFADEAECSLLRARHKVAPSTSTRLSNDSTESRLPH